MKKIHLCAILLFSSKKYPSTIDGYEFADGKKGLEIMKRGMGDKF